MSRYERLAAVIDEIKVDGSRDTDEYVAEILAIMADDLMEFARESGEA